jgi:flagellar basal-body rod protein FlgC
MDYFSSFEISASGLVAERLRLEAVAANLANANSTAAPGTTPYQPVRVLSRPIDAAFTQHLDAAQRPLPAGVQVQGVERMPVAPRMVYQPQHPDADASGFVAHANVDPLSEMVTMMSAVRAYEANIKAIRAAQAMAQKALDIGSGK